MRKAPFLLFLVPAAILADTVFLKGAGTISGRIVEQNDEVVLVDIGGGTMGVPMANVDHIEKARCSLDDYDDRAAKLQPNDVNGWRKLGAWATQQGLPVQATEAYRKVLAVAPNDTAANEALGFVQLNGRWVTEEESYKARGFVKYEGEWMSPGDAQALQAQAANDDARRAAEQRAINAENAASAAQARAEEAEKRAKEAEEDAQQNSYPGYWGGWGYGVTTWPSGYTINHPRANRPASAPVRTPR